MAQRGKKPTGPRAAVEISVFDHTGAILPKAKVTINPAGQKQKVAAVQLKFDKQRQVYRAEHVPPGPYVMRVAATGMQPDERALTVGHGTLEAVSVLGKQGMPAYYRGQVRVPFDPPKNLLGVALRPDISSGEEKRLATHAARLGLRPEKVADEIRTDNVIVYRIPSSASNKERKRIQAELARSRSVRLCGPVIRLDKDSVTFLINELIVKFKADVSDEEIPGIAQQMGLTVVRKLEYASAYLLRGPTHAGLQLLKTAERLVQSRRVEYAEPNLVATAVDDQVNPTDYQYPEQWHLPLIGMPLTWQALQNLNPSLTFGDPNIVIAVLDRGIQSATVAGTVQPSHPDFNGVLTDGSNKVYQFYDFSRMVANNNNPPNNHGMGCASVATALANNATAVPGVNEGVAGSAPNCRVMGLIRPAGGTEVQYADAYIWTAGFNPGWTVDVVNYGIGTVFPAPITPGADVITNSFGASSGAPISGLMQDVMDYLTTYGRGGKGCCLFFSAGNNAAVAACTGAQMGNLRPWASYKKTMAVSASTLANDGVTEVIASYSNFGNAVDFCAPSNDNCQGRHNPPQFYGIISANLVGQGNLIGQPVSQTATTANSVAGAVVLNVANTAGFAARAIRPGRRTGFRGCGIGSGHGHRREPIDCYPPCQPAPERNGGRDRCE